MHLLFLYFLLQGAQLRKHIDATLGSGNLREAVRLPPGEDINEWLAVNSTLLLSYIFSPFTTCSCYYLAKMSHLHNCQNCLHHMTNSRERSWLRSRINFSVVAVFHWMPSRYLAFLHFTFFFKKPDNINSLYKFLLLSYRLQYFHLECFFHHCLFGASARSYCNIHKNYK